VPDLTTFVVNLLSTFIGVGLGLASALWQERRARRRERNDRIRIAAESLLNELDSVHKALDDVAAIDMTEDESGAIEIDLSLPIFPAFAFAAVVEGGAVSLMRPETQSSLSSFYELLRLPRLIVDRMAVMAGFPQDNPRTDALVIHNLVGHLKSQCAMLLDLVSDVTAKVDQELVLAGGSSRRTTRPSASPAGGPEEVTA
jgi:hypothetical protein